MSSFLNTNITGEHTSLNRFMDPCSTRHFKRCLAEMDPFEITIVESLVPLDLKLLITTLDNKNQVVYFYTTSWIPFRVAKMIQEIRGGF